ncbi:unnamed protein product [Prorocentrum cordatum]|uniref:Uncharacterized protein n=1 Tax=Prorocentrum cordatum TaxID=2364126 RepID=A0ABN9WTM4_9DINO|nr:unnamed protein product [Polarella glacialis]
MAAELDGGLGQEAACAAGRLAMFVVGCLGSASRKKAGEKLGLMGSCSEEDFAHVLRHLEILTMQRAAKLAGAPPDVAAAGGQTCKQEPFCCSQTFLVALCSACGIPAVGAAEALSEVFGRLPRDASGRADLLSVFGMEPPAAAPAVDGAACAAFPADYVERPADLPPASDDDLAEAERRLLEAEAAESSWQADVVAINVVRAAVLRQAGAHGGAEGHRCLAAAPLVASVARRCSSRRPALSKSALLAISEICEGAPAGGDWGSALEEGLAGCAAALRSGTKVTARLAEAALAAAVRRHAAEARRGAGGARLETDEAPGRPGARASGRPGAKPGLGKIAPSLCLQLRRQGGHDEFTGCRGTPSFLVDFLKAPLGHKLIAVNQKGDLTSVSGGAVFACVGCGAWAQQRRKLKLRSACVAPTAKGAEVLHNLRQGVGPHKKLAKFIDATVQLKRIAREEANPVTVTTSIKRADPEGPYIFEVRMAALHERIKQKKLERQRREDERNGILGRSSFVSMSEENARPVSAGGEAGDIDT